MATLGGDGMVPMLPVMTNHHVVMGNHVVTQNGPGPAVPHAAHHVPNAAHIHVQAAHQVAAQQHQTSMAAAHAAMASQHQQQQHQQHQQQQHQQQHIHHQNNQSNHQSHQATPVLGSTLSPQAHTSNTSNQNSSSEGNSKKTPKEKTPMCQVNEIAKYNKLTPKYTLTAEEGPPHHKTFTVTLDLGQKETWQGTGTSIKKAQHAAAKNAIEQCTSLEKPKYKPKRPKSVNVDALTPTVKLNGLAMKRGVMAAYKMVDRKPVYPSNPQFPDGVPQIYPNAPNGAKARNTRVPKLFVVELNVGTQIIVCEGRTRQQARHAAAEKGLQYIQSLAYFEANLAPEKKPPRATENPANVGGGQGGGNRSSGDNKTENSSTEKSTPGPKKSEVSLVYELALKRNLPVHFEKLAEEGPPHLKHYSMRLHVGKTPDDLAKEKAGEVPKRQEGETKKLYFTSDGQAQSKKLARRKAATVVLAEMRALIEQEEKEKPTTPKSKGRHKKKSSVIKETNNDSPDPSLHPVSRLAQIQQAHKEREPIYQVISERSVARKKEFVMQCIVSERISQGMGPNKKIAKRNSAQAMLQLMGHEPSANYPGENETGEGKKEKSADAPASPNAMAGANKANAASGSSGANVSAGGGAAAAGAAGQGGAQGGAQPQSVPTIVNPAAAASRTPAHGQTAEPQLRYLASLQGFQVQFTDFPKDGQFLSLVSIDTSPPLVAHGNGTTIPLAHEEASSEAMKLLMTRGLQTAK